MKGFSILTTRKRALVALVHSVIFLAIAAAQVLFAKPAQGIWIPSAVPVGTWILCGILATVSGVLLWLYAVAGIWIEKLYFGMCTASATSGLLRTAAGDQVFHAGVFLRVVLLASAVLVGTLIVRRHSAQPVQA